MSRKFWLIIGVVCVILGGSLFSCVMGILDWDFNKLNTVEYETKTKEITDEFKNIKIVGSVADISFEVVPDNICKVVYTEEENYGYNVYVENNTLNILLEDTREWEDYINISSDQSQITVYLPQNQFEDIDLKNSTGNVSVSNISCNNMNIEGSTSDINLNNVIALKKLSVSVSTGDTVFNGCDAEEIYVSCSTGDISGTLLSEKVFTATVSTGDVSLPDTNSGGSCKLITSTGDINIKIK